MRKCGKVNNSSETLLVDFSKKWRAALCLPASTAHYFLGCAMRQRQQLQRVETYCSPPHKHIRAILPKRGSAASQASNLRGDRTATDTEDLAPLRRLPADAAVAHILQARGRFLSRKLRVCRAMFTNSCFF